jgi:DUF2934 family protein
MNEKTFESLEELRYRLLRNESVQEMIRARAYEIYHLRGIQPGGAAQDWFQAESEVLAFLLAHHPEHVPETEDEPGAAPSITAPPDTAAPKKRKSRSTSSLASGSKTKETTAKKAATKRSKSKKASVAKPKSKRSRKEPESEDKTI